MRTRFNSSQRSALLALADGSLRHGDHGWLAEGEGSTQQLSDGIVRWLFGEGFLINSEFGYRLGGRGEAALREAREEERVFLASDATIDVDEPVLLLNPAPHSEELDYLLVVPIGESDLERHRSRMRQLSALQAEEQFEFVQFRDEVFALPITPRLAELELLPAAAALFLDEGLGDVEALGIRHCPDRGVNYGSGWLQWFGGFDPESPLVVSARMTVEEFARFTGTTSWN